MDAARSGEAGAVSFAQLVLFPEMVRRSDDGFESRFFRAAVCLDLSAAVVSAAGREIGDARGNLDGVVYFAGLIAHWR